MKKEIKNKTSEEIYGEIITNKVKMHFRTWSNFNKKIKKSNKNNKKNLVKKIINLNDILLEINLRIELNDANKNFPDSFKKSNYKRYSKID